MESSWQVVLEKQGFVVDQKGDLTADELVREVNSFSKRPEIEHGSMDHVFFMGHGKAGAIFGLDNKPVKVSELMPPFADSNRPLLREITKWFAFQSCRSEFSPKSKLNLFLIGPILLLDSPILECSQDY